MKYNNYKKLSNIQKYYFVVNTAKIVQKRFNYLLEQKSGLHCHHIKPKSLYPDLIDDKENLIKVPAIIHWALHKILLEYYKEINNEVAIKKMSYVNLEDFINKFYENRKKKFNFKEFEVEFINDDISYNFLISTVLDFCIKIIYTEKLVQIFEQFFSKNYKKLKNFKKIRKQVLEKISEKTKFFREIIKKYYLNLTEDLLDMYGEDIKDELDDCYKDFDDLYNTLKSIEEEDHLERIKEELQNITDEELRERLESL